MATTFTLEHEFLDIPLSLFVAHLNDPKLNEMIRVGLGLDERVLLSKKEDTESVTWQYRITKCGDIPKALQKLVKENALSWQETSRFVRKENCIYWEITPLSKLLKFHGEGSFKIEKLGEGCKRILKGSVTVDLPFVGKMVEGFIINELVKGYELEPEIQKAFYKSVA